MLAQRITNKSGCTGNKKSGTSRHTERLDRKNWDARYRGQLINTNKANPRYPYGLTEGYEHAAYLMRIDFKIDIRVALN